MFRITQQPLDSRAILLKLEGKLFKPWIDELKSSINSSLARHDLVKLDLSGLTYADVAGTRILADVIRQGAAVIACSGYVAALLEMEKS
jgi:ABC-type transporter Mla MlaB component